jgi:putative transposase
MQRFQSFKYELMPTGEQERKMRQFAGSCRYVYNKALALQKERYAKGEKHLSYFDLAKLLTEWRNSTETAWLADAPCDAQQQALKDLEQAYTNFFAQRTNYPRFKKKERSVRFRYPNPQRIKLDQNTNRITLPRLESLRYRNSREVVGKLRNATVSWQCGKWFVSIMTLREINQPIPQGGAVGIDMGTVRFATFSDGSYIEPLNSFKQHAVALRKANQAMSRKRKFSNNWKKAKTRVQRIHSRIANVRHNFLHKATTTISKNHALVCIEDLQVENMSRSAKGTMETPGRNVGTKSALNKSIRDQAWSKFRHQLDYKLRWSGGVLITVPPQNTSKICPSCEYASKENRLTQARFKCVECGFEQNADVVAAINVLRAGYARLACEVSGAVMPPAAGTHRGEAVCYTQ